MHHNVCVGVCFLAALLLDDSCECLDVFSRKGLALSVAVAHLTSYLQSEILLNELICSFVRNLML